jgi:hypothetical protein
VHLLSTAKGEFGPPSARLSSWATNSEQSLSIKIRSLQPGDTYLCDVFASHIFGPEGADGEGTIVCTTPGYPLAVCSNIIGAAAVVHNS